MENYIIIGAIAVIMFFAVLSSIKHFKGEGGCCGGGSYKPRKKKLKSVKYKKLFKITGMNCKHCKARVEEAVNDIAAVSCAVSLKKGEMTVYYAEEVDDDIIKMKIEAAGYTLKK